jgi:hypothetical protein
MTVIGIVLILLGAGQIGFRARTARAGAASNRELYGGRMGGSGFMAYSKTMSIIVGAAFIVVGILIAFG